MKCIKIKFKIGILRINMKCYNINGKIRKVMKFNDGKIKITGIIVHVQ